MNTLSTASQFQQERKSEPRKRGEPRTPYSARLKAYTSVLSYEQRLEFAERAGTNDAYLSQLINGQRTPSADMARRLAEASGWRILPADIHPLFEGIPSKRNRTKPQ